MTRLTKRRRLAAVPPSPGDRLPPRALGEGRGRGREILRDLLKGLLALAFVLTLKLVVEHTAFGKQLELSCYNLLQLQLSSERPPITVVDISDLKPEEFDVDGQVGTGTPREPLRKMIAAITEHKPKAIGVVIDFSPDEYGYIHPSDPEFFQFCLDMGRQRGTPIFLGINRTLAEPPDKWLGDAKYQELAAGILIPRDSKRMQSEVKIESELKAGAGQRRAARSKAMSVALVDAYRTGLEDAPGWLQRAHVSVLERLRSVGFIEKVSEREMGRGLTVADFLVDFSPIDSIESVRTLDPVVLRDRSQRERFEGKVVLIGAGSSGAAKDLFQVPGREALYPGVVLHACAVHTLTESPLYDVTHRGRLYIDVLFALAVLIPISLIRLFYKGSATGDVATHRLQGILTVLVVLAAVVVGVLSVRFTRVMWADFLLAFAALVFHPSIERRLASSWRWLRRSTPDLFRRLVFVRKKENP